MPTTSHKGNGHKQSVAFIHTMLAVTVISETAWWGPALGDSISSTSATAKPVL